MEFVRQAWSIELLAIERAFDGVGGDGAAELLGTESGELFDVADPVLDLFLEELDFGAGPVLIGGMMAAAEVQLGDLIDCPFGHLAIVFPGHHIVCPHGAGAWGVIAGFHIVGAGAIDVAMALSGQQELEGEVGIEAIGGGEHATVVGEFACQLADLRLEFCQMVAQGFEFGNGIEIKHRHEMKGPLRLLLASADVCMPDLAIRQAESWRLWGVQRTIAMHNRGGMIYAADTAA